VVSRRSLFLSVACLQRTIGKPVAGPESNGRATNCLWLEPGVSSQGGLTARYFALLPAFTVPEMRARPPMCVPTVCL
jgi:hypothetical protein